MPTETVQEQRSPAEIAIAEAEAAREEFFGRASEIYDAQAQARSTAINPMADKLSNLAPKPKTDEKTSGTPTAQPAPAAPESAVPPQPSDAAAGNLPAGTSKGAIPGPSTLAQPGATTQRARWRIHGAWRALSRTRRKCSQGIRSGCSRAFRLGFELRISTPHTQESDP